MAKEAQVTGTEAGASFDSAWEDVRADGDIQYEVVSPPEPPETPQWWLDFLEWLAEVAAPVVEAIADAWPVIRIVLLLLLAIGVLTLLWVILSPFWEEWRGRKPSAEAYWEPEAAAARQLLDEAELLADAGQFDEATHLLLYRSIEDIKKRKPNLLRPSSTSREIGRFDSLPQTARAMFEIIADQVERSVFKATPIGEEGWTRSRDAYRNFALPKSWKAGTGR